jgi:hypothetical protein
MRSTQLNARRPRWCTSSPISPLASSTECRLVSVVFFFHFQKICALLPTPLFKGGGKLEYSVKKTPYNMLCITRRLIPDEILCAVAWLGISCRQRIAGVHNA